MVLNQLFVPYGFFAILFWLSIHSHWCGLQMMTFRKLFSNEGLTQIRTDPLESVSRCCNQVAINPHT